MKLKLLLPQRVFLEAEVAKVVAEASNGSFCILPRHIDFVTALVPGLLAYEPAGGGEIFVAVDQGILVKCGPEVIVSTRNAVSGPEIGVLRDRITEEFEVLDEQERTTESALARLEADLVRRFLELDRHGA